MNGPMNEVTIVQNPCLGAALIWHFADAYIKEKKKGVPFLIIFLVLPILFHRTLRGLIKGTQTASGFPKVLEKLTKSREVDLLEGVNSYCKDLRPVTLSSIRMLLFLKLASLDTSTAELVTSSTIPQLKDDGEVSEMVGIAKKLGTWFSQRSLYEIGMLLRVRF